MATQTIDIQVRGEDGSPVSLAVPIKWRGQSLAVHKPYVRDCDTGEAKATARRKLWGITHVDTGLVVAFNVPVALGSAIALATLWDERFGEIHSQEEAETCQWVRDWFSDVARVRNAQEPEGPKPVA